MKGFGRTERSLNDLKDVWKKQKNWEITVDANRGTNKII